MKKKETFQMRMSAETRRQLNQLKDIYQLSAGSVVCMLIADKMREIEKDGSRRKENDCCES